MRSIGALLRKTGLLEGDLDYHLVRASMVILFLFFGYQRWFDYEAQTLVPFISDGPERGASHRRRRATLAFSASR